MIRYLRLVVCMILFCAPALPSAATTTKGENGNVTVLLFHTEAVQRLQVHSHNAAIRLCSTCAEQRGPVSLEIRVRGNSMLDSADKPLDMIAFDGVAEVLTGGGHRAEAAGHWSISVDQAQLRVHIEIPRERYVEAVLAAEAGPAEPNEALKALAVTARSFAAAVAQRHDGGALCDTTHCQALRLAPVPQPLRDAVWSTSGETIWLGSKQVPAYFSEHCGGFTEDASSAWGGAARPWLTARVDTWCARSPSQWHASLPEADVRHALASEGFPLASPIEEIAAVSRDRSGRVQQLRLRSSDATRTLPAATFRFALNRSLGWYQLRSDRYQVRRVGDRIIFEGAGFGHGVGLCQAGASAMAQAGKSYREILHAYFPNTTVRVRAQDAGWVSLPANGFTLRAIGPVPALEKQAADAFADARTRWALPIKGSPTLTIFPTTEAFRQATGQPGWELATTQGAQIATQPPDVLTAHGDAVPVFRHEFLHSFVEAEASASAPLWLREGLVAVLNGESCSAQVHAPPESIDAALRGGGSLAQSQQAHTAACVLTKRIIAEHGTGGVHAMLQRH